MIDNVSPSSVKKFVCSVPIQARRDFSSDAVDLRPAHVPGTLAASP